jgi:2-desacetyl-2-hydroxyethyl bacteriochlorophyllide A dehydrogenase
MRAALFKGAGQPLVVESRADPDPGPAEAVIKVHRCGICGSDLHMTSGHAMDYPIGSVIGHEFAGEVVALGSAVERLKVGDRITAMPMTGCGRCVMCAAGYPAGCAGMRGMVGGFGEYVRVAEASAMRLPATLSMADGALVEPLAVALHGVALAAMQPGARVLVLGAGAVGLATIYWARLLGAGRIVASSPSARRAELALAMGATAYETLGEGESERIQAALGGMPDIVFECAGAVGLLQKSVELVQPAGTIVSLGFCTAPDPVVPSLATWKQVTIKFSFAYTLGEFEHAAGMLDRGHVEPRSMITRTVSLDAFPDAFEAQRLGSTQTKVQLDPWATP